jgi:hypothetical protein
VNQHFINFKVIDSPAVSVLRKYSPAGKTLHPLLYAELLLKEDNKDLPQAD